MSTEIEKASNELQRMANNPSIQKRLESILGARAPQFVSSLITITQSSFQLQKCDPKSIMASAMIAATLDLPINQNLGFAHIVPYSGKAQFQMGYKGFIQLAQRSGQFATMNDLVIPDGVFVSFDPLAEKLELDWSQLNTEADTHGYAFHFRLINGFSKTIYWSRAKVVAHATRFSQAYRAGKKDSPWFTSFDSMALKTVIKHGLSKYAPLSVEMRKALDYDQSIPDLDGNREYPDNPKTTAQGDNSEAIDLPEVDEAELPAESE